MAPIVGGGALLLACAVLAWVVGGESAIGLAAGEGAASVSGFTAAADKASTAAADKASTAAAGEALEAASGAAVGAAPRGARSPDPPAAAAAEAPPIKRRCGGCGVVVSTREAADRGVVDGSVSTALPADFGSQWPVAAPTRYTFTVHLEDGSKRLINDTNPLAWRIGERVMIIDGGPVVGR